MVILGYVVEVLGIAAILFATVGLVTAGILGWRG